MPGGAGAPSTRPSHTSVRESSHRRRARPRRAARRRRCARRGRAWSAGARPSRPRSAPAPPPGRRSGSGSIRFDARARRPRVDQRGARHDHRAALAPERHADAVAAVGDALAVVGARRPTPARSGRCGPTVAPSASRRTASPALSTTSTRDLAALAQLDLEAVDLLAAVAVGREDAREAHDLRHRGLALDPLGGEERRERRADEQHEDRAREGGHLRSLVGAEHDHDVGRQGARLVRAVGQRLGLLVDLPRCA